MNGSDSPSEQTNGASRNDLSAAVNAADAYFSSINTNMSSMAINGDEGFGGSPTIGTVGERQYVVNQNNPEQVYQPEVGNLNGDLLLM